MKRIVVDAGPLIHLHEAGSLNLLSRAGEVFAPAIIVAEARSIGDLPEWLTIKEPLLANDNLIRQWLAGGVIDRGEAAALALADELRADWFLTDDSAARLVAKSFGLEVRGSLGVILWAAQEQVVNHPQALQLLEAIERGSLWISLRVRTEARRALEVIRRTHERT